MAGPLQRRTPPNTANRAARAAWGVCWLLFFRVTPSFLHSWRRMILRLFGARVGDRAHVYPSARIWAPWNLVMEADACLASYVDCYNVDSITLKQGATVSQYSYLCSASRDHDDPSMPLVTGPITLGVDAWVAADVFIGPGVTIGDRAVIGARSSVFGDIPPNTVAVGSPARVIRSKPL
jgi:putative colanic acid biosynthesis acetyltransferase WcaF